MKKLTTWMALGAIAVMCGMIGATNAMAQKPEASFLRITQPLDVGGTILEPGVYVITLLPLVANRNTLQVTSEDRSKVYATLLSIPHATGEKVQVNTEYVFYPATADSPQALRTWFAPDSATQGGHDIVYPTGRAMQLAAVVKEPVVAYKDETKTEELKTAALVVVTPTKEVVAYTEPLPTKTGPMTSASSEMPGTASQLPLLAALGLLMIVAAVGLRAIRVA